MTPRKKFLIGTAVVGLIVAGFATAQTMSPGDGQRAMTHMASGGPDQDQRGGHRRGGGLGMMQMMEVYDTNGDSALTQEELMAARAAQLGKFDTNGDGQLDLTEYQALWLDAMRERMVDQFQAHDADGDGLVTAEEFGRRFANMVPRMDRNGDGMLNHEDFMGGRERGERPSK